MSAADVHDHMRAMRKIHPVHQIPAYWTRDVVDGRNILNVLRFRFHHRPRHPHHRRLFFLVLADLVQRIGVGPNAFATRTFPQGAAADDHRVHHHAAARANFRLGVRDLRSIRPGSAMRTEFFPDEHHAKALGAGDRGQPRPAMFAPRGLRRGRRAAHRTIQCFRGHQVFLSLFTVHHSKFTLRPWRLHFSAKFVLSTLALRNEYSQNRKRKGAL